MKRTGVLIGNFENNPFEVPRNPEGYQFLHNTLSPVIFWLNTLGGTAKAPALTFLRLNTLKGTKTTFF